MAVLIAAGVIGSAYGGPPEARQPKEQQQPPAGDELRITVCAQRHVQKALPYETTEGKETSYSAREAEYRVVNTTERNVFFVSTEPLPINLGGTRFSQSLSWPKDIRVLPALVPTPTVTRIAPGEEKRFKFAYAQAKGIVVEFAYASQLDEESSWKLRDLNARAPTPSELDWFRGVARRQRVTIGAMEEKSSVPVRITPCSYTVHRVRSKRKHAPQPYQMEQRAVFNVCNASEKPIAFLWTGPMPGVFRQVSGYVSQGLRWDGRVRMNQLPALRARRLDPGDSMEIESSYDYDGSIIRTNFAYWKDLSPEDWEKLAGFAERRPIRAYEGYFRWFLASTDLVQVEFALPTVPDVEFKDSKPPNHWFQPQAPISRNLTPRDVMEIECKACSQRAAAPHRGVRFRLQKPVEVSACRNVHRATGCS